MKPKEQDLKKEYTNFEINLGQIFFFLIWSHSLLFWLILFSKGTTSAKLTTTIQLLIKNLCLVSGASSAWCQISSRCKQSKIRFIKKSDFRERRMAFSWNAEPLMESTSATACYLRFSLDGWFTIWTPGALYAMMTSISILQVLIVYVYIFWFTGKASSLKLSRKPMKISRISIEGKSITTSTHIVS